MGLVYRENKALIRDYPDEPTLPWRKALIVPGQDVVEVDAAKASATEVEALLTKLDTLAFEINNEAIARALVTEADSVITLFRIVKKKVGGAATYRGIQGAGVNLDLAWLRAKHIGGLLLNKVGTASKGVWGQANGTVTWLYATFVAGTAKDYLPKQQMADDAGLIHIGVIDPVVNPHLDAVEFKQAGRTCPAQSLNFNVRRAFNETAVPFVKFELPVLVQPLVSQQITAMPTIGNGNTKLQLISILCASADDLVL